MSTSFSTAFPRSMEHAPTTQQRPELSRVISAIFHLVIPFVTYLVMYHELGTAFLSNFTTVVPLSPERRRLYLALNIFYAVRWAVGMITNEGQGFHVYWTICGVVPSVLSWVAVHCVLHGFLRGIILPSHSSGLRSCQSHGCCGLLATWVGNAEVGLQARSKQSRKVAHHGIIWPRTWYKSHGTHAPWLCFVHLCSQSIFYHLPGLGLFPRLYHLPRNHRAHEEEIRWSLQEVWSSYAPSFYSWHLLKRWNFSDWKVWDALCIQELLNVTICVIPVGQ